MRHTKRTGNDGHAIAALAERQHGVVARRQLRALGLSDTEITTRTAAGYLQPIFRETFAVGHRQVDRRARMLAAVLACGDGAILSHGSAAELIGLWDKRAVPVDVIPPGWSGRKIQDIRWHRVLFPTPEEIEIRDGIRCTTPARTLVDMAGRVGQQSLRRLIEQAAVLDKLDVREVDRILAQGRRRGAPNLRALLDVWRTDDERKPRLRSLLEAHFLPTLVTAGVPAPECNIMLHIDGEPLEIDLLWKEQRLAIETDGEETHGTRGAFQSDRRRDQLLLAAGYRVGRVTWRQAEEEPAAVTSRIKRMLAIG
jgi:hypothetical protein